MKNQADPDKRGVPRSRRLIFCGVVPNKEN